MSSASAPAATSQLEGATRREPPVTIVVVGQVPPPVNGQSLMISSFLEGKYTEIQLVHVPMRFSRSTAEIGSPGPRKLGLLLTTLMQIIAARIKSSATILYYPPAGANLVPVLRDLVLLIPTRLLFRKTVFHFHAAGLWNIYNRLPCILRPLFRIAYNSPDLAIFTTSATSAEAVHLHARKTAIIPCGIPDNASPVLNNEPDASPMILFAGILCEEKGVLILLEACRLLQVAHISFRLTCIGAFQSVVLEEKVKILLQESGLDAVATFPGVVTGMPKHQLFQHADIFCFPSYYPAESFGVVLIEAMSYSLPVVATHWQGIPEVVGRNPDGSNPDGALLVPIQDPVALAKALEIVLLSSQTRKTMGHHNRARYLERFTVDRYQKSLEQQLSSLK